MFDLVTIAREGLIGLWNLLVISTTQLSVANIVSLLGGLSGAYAAYTNWPRLQVGAVMQDHVDWHGPEGEDEPTVHENVISIDVMNPTWRRLTIMDVRLASYRGWRRFWPWCTPNRQINMKHTCPLRSGAIGS